MIGTPLDCGLTISEEVWLPTHEFQRQVWGMVSDVADKFFSDGSQVHDQQSCMESLSRHADDIIMAYDADGNIAALVYLVGLIPGLSCTLHGFARKDIRSPKFSTTVFRGMIEHVYRKHKIMRLESLVPVHNRTSKLLLLRAGFRCEGTLRSYARFNGVPTDFWVLSIIREV